MDLLKDYIRNNQENLEDTKSLKIKMFNYFYYMLNVKNIISFFTLYILHSFEIIQLISFAFSHPLELNWNISEKKMKYIQYIVEGFRIVPLFRYISFNSFMIIFYFLFSIVIILFISLIFQILFFKENSKCFLYILSWTVLIMPYLTIFLFLPLNELFLLPFKCKNNSMLSQEVQCYKNKHLILAILGVVGEIIFFLYIYLLNSFYYYPFVVRKTTIKLTPDVDLLLMKIKLVQILMYLFLKNQYLSIFILLFLSLYLIYFNLNKKIYPCRNLEIFLNIRNALFFWTFFILLISRMCIDTNFNNIIFLLVLGYPLIIFGFTMFYQKKENQLMAISTGINDNINTCLNSIKTFVDLIQSFIDENKSNSKYDENFSPKNGIMLKGIIQIHTSNCIKEDCPLTNFIRNEGNFSTQKQCLLNYMTILFNEAMRKFPNDILIRMHYIQFNYNQKYNLNRVKTTFEEIKKLQFGIHSQYILYSQEKEISKMQLNDINDGNEEEKEKANIEQNFKTFKNLISNTTKLYVEFWSIFSANITNSLNTSKLYKLGEKLNGYLKEINNLWNNNLRYKKINFENQNIIQLYARFLKEILWDQQKSEAVQKKINEEQYLQEFNKIKDENKINMRNIDSIESQDFVIYANTTEKGKCNIIQFSNSLSYVIGYQKSELINKPLDLIIPSILDNNHQSLIENYIKRKNVVKDSDKYNFIEAEKKSSFIILKNKMGYIIPFNSKFNLYDDNDFSNSYLIKAKLETTDNKSMYAFYLLTKPDFSLDSFSSSAIHLGFSMDLLKKYVIKLNLLIRSGRDKNLNLFEKYKDYVDNERIITWVFPDIIYPKNENDKGNDKDKDIQDLINESNKKKFYLQIFEMKYKENEISGFVFKLYDIAKNSYKKKEELYKKEFIPGDNRQIIFDLLNLNYIRTIIVKKKSGLRNLREIEEQIEEEDDNKKNKGSKKRAKKYLEIKHKDESSEDEQTQIVITKEKLLELQTRDSVGIKSFINILPFYGSDISLIKHRPNREKYPTGKAQEPLIKITLSRFTKRIEIKIKENPNLFKKKQKIENDENINEDNDNIIKNDYLMNNEIKSEEKKNDDIILDVDNELIGNNSTVSLANILNVNSLKIIKYIDFLIYIFTLAILIIEFILSYNFFSNHVERYTFFKYSYRLLSDLAYIKYYVTEGICATELNYYMMSNSQTEKTYLKKTQENIKEYLTEVNDIISKFDNSKMTFSQEYINYVSSTNVSIKSLNNGVPTIEVHPFISAKTKLTNALFHISTSDNGIDFSDKYAYELMVNLLNSYYLAFERIIIIMSDDFNNSTKNCGVKNIVIFSVALFGSVIYLIIFYNLMLKLDNDREKPINLFLTIKNSVFEDLKTSAENFSNKLLNKIFGVDEEEEESQKDFQANIKPKDINIAKFKALNDYRLNNKKGTSFLFYFVQLLIFYGIVLFILLMKYINTIFYYKNTKDFIKIYNATNFAEIYAISAIDIMKQYFFDTSITNYGFNETTQIFNFLSGFMTISTFFSETIKETSKAECFLKNEYRDLFTKYYYQNCSEMFNSKDRYYAVYTRTGFRTINGQLVEYLRFLYISYFVDNKINASNLYSSDYINDVRWSYIDKILFSISKPWYRYMIEAMDQFFCDDDYDKQSTHILTFAIMIIAISLYYWIAWKKYEEEFINSIQRSFDLINLIPEEVKNIIVKKLNENGG